MVKSFFGEMKEQTNESLAETNNQTFRIIIHLEL